MLLDIGMGLLLTTMFAAVTGAEPSWQLPLVGIAGCLAPDVDFIIWILRGKKLDHLTHQHRDLLHRPLIFTPLTTTLVWLWLGPSAAVLFGTGTVAHFIHDTIGQGWGILLFWPLDSRFYCIRSYGDQPRQLYGWTKEEQDELCEEHGNRHWMQQDYGRLGGPLMRECIVLIAGLITLILWATHY